MITPSLSPEALAYASELAEFRRTATRLHPRPGAVSVEDSHIGGPLRWPADEPWPVCEASYMVEEDVPIPAEIVARLRAAEARRPAPHMLAEGEAAIGAEIAELVGPGFSGWGTEDNGQVVGHRYGPRAHPRPQPMVPLAQLRAADIPDLPRPGGADLLQVLWCPFDHDEGPWGPTLRLVWRREAEVTDILTEPPRGEVGNENYVPRPCGLHPEQVDEYPDPEELPEDLAEEVDEWEVDYADTFLAPGWKVGGYAPWNVTDLLPTPCPRCGGPTNLLLVIASSEYDGGTRDRWRPIEEQHIDWGHPDRLTLQEPTGITVGRHASLRIFACLSCPDTPYLLDLQ